VGAGESQGDWSKKMPLQKKFFLLKYQITSEGLDGTFEI